MQVLKAAVDWLREVGHLSHPDDAISLIPRSLLLLDGLLGNHDELDSDDAHLLRYRLELERQRRWHDLFVRLRDADIAAVASRGLTGSVDRPLVALLARTSPYKLEGTLLIAKDSTLVLMPGTRIACAPDSEIVVAGKLLILGESASPVTIAGSRSGFDYWKGITVREGVADIHHARIADARIGLQVVKSTATISSSQFSGNRVGLRGGDYGASSTISVFNSELTENAEAGVRLSGTSVEMDFCSVVGNGGWGIEGTYYVSPALRATIVARNRTGGIYCRMYQSKLTAWSCVIGDNGDADLKISAPNDWTFTQCFFGKEIATLLRASGATANLPNVHDGADDGKSGRAVFEQTRTEPPRDYGAKRE